MNIVYVVSGYGGSGGYSGPELMMMMMLRQCNCGSGPSEELCTMRRANE